MTTDEAIRQLAQQITDDRFPMKNGTTSEFNRIVNDAKQNYDQYCSSIESIEVDGEQIDVEMHMVGQNASHVFYIGILPDGRFVKRSYDCCFDEENISIRTNVGYIGHW